MMRHDLDSAYRFVAKIKRRLDEDERTEIIKRPKRVHCSKYSQFLEQMRLLKTAKTNQMPIFEAIRQLLRDHRDLWKTFVSFMPPNSPARAKFVTEIKKLEETNKPAKFNEDMLGCILQILPYPSMGRLATTCRWMRNHISKDHLFQALNRARQTHGQVRLLREPGDAQIFEIRSPNDETIGMSILHRFSTLLRIQFRGQQFIAECRQTECRANASSRAEVVRTMTRIMPELLDHAADMQEVRMWFRFDQPRSEMFSSPCIELFVNYAPFAALLRSHNVNPRDPANAVIYARFVCFPLMAV